MRTSLKIGIAVGIVALGGLAAVAPYWVAHNRAAVARAMCVETLQTIAGAKGEWALEKELGSNAVPTWNDLRPYGAMVFNLRVQSWDF
jgi:malate synthase